MNKIILLALIIVGAAGGVYRAFFIEPAPEPAQGDEAKRPSVALGAQKEFLINGAKVKFAKYDFLDVDFADANTTVTKIVAKNSNGSSCASMIKSADKGASEHAKMVSVGFESPCDFTEVVMDTNFGRYVYKNVARKD